MINMMIETVTAVLRRCSRASTYFQARRVANIIRDGRGGICFEDRPSRGLISLAPPRSISSAKKSFCLLYQWLTPKQAYSLRNDNYFCVRGGCTGGIYIIVNSATNNIFSIGPYRKQRSLQVMCVELYDVFGTMSRIPYWPLPRGDLLLGEKILLENTVTERGLLRIANKETLHAACFWAEMKRLGVKVSINVD